MENRIGIIIPAYKDTYMREMLESLVTQDLKNCHIYIGDDNSPYNIESIVNKYKDKLPITYKRFEQNLGGIDLVRQWMRCVELDKDSEWIWLFSDDDIMCQGCVSSVKREILKHNEEYDVFHINGVIVDNKLDEIGNTPLFPEFVNTSEYIKKIILNRDNSWGINYIVKRSKFEIDNGFVNFDLAWNSDRASWLKFSYPKGIYTVPDAKVLWRYSGENITSLKTNVSVIRRKAKSRIEFTKWLNLFMSNCDIKWEVSRYERLVYLLRCLKNDMKGGILMAIGVFVKCSKHILG